MLVSNLMYSITTNDDYLSSYLINSLIIILNEGEDLSISQCIRYMHRSVREGSYLIISKHIETRRYYRF